MSSDPFKHLKKAMNETVFQEMSYLEKQKKKTLALIEENNGKSIDILILKTLQSSNKTGYEIFKHLQQTCAKEQLLDQEGSLYIYLHRLEQKGLVASTWMEKEGQSKKHYYLEKKGKKLLAVMDNANVPKAKNALKLQVEGGIL